MNRATLRQILSVAVSLTALTATRAYAQRSVSITGHVTSGGQPLVGAHVRIDELKIDRTTNADGRYSLLVASASVHGQTVTIVASMSDRRVRYSPKSARIDLVGEPVVQDFDLVLVSGAEPVAATVGSTVAVDTARSQSTTRVAPAAARDAIEIGDVAGPVDLPSVLVGRVTSLSVSPASVPGGSAQLIYRGPRSVLGSSQPLYVVDGLRMDNTVFASAAQRFGLGGFDYGSAISDLGLTNIESVRVLTGADAAAAYGGRGANSVIAVTTKSGLGGPHFGVSAGQEITNESYIRLPSFQNSYGQGLNGKFEFFNGKGGGVNDGVDQSWGPPLDNRPVAQASYKDPGQADVRLWQARPNNVQNYFESGRTTNTTVSVQGRNDVASIRVAGANRTTTGITPRNSVERRDGAVHLSFQPSPRLDVSLAGLGVESKNEDAPGTGFGESNPVFQFVRMGRQVDTDSLRRHLRDASGKQISWIYNGHNNPYVLSLADTNYSSRYHLASSGRATYALNPWLSATAEGGVDYYRDGRLFRIASGWMGGFPFYAGAGDFSKGGSEGDEVGVQQNSAAFRLDAKRTLANGTRWTVGGGADLLSTSQHVRTAGVDSVANVPSAGAPDSARVPSAASWQARSSTNSVFGETGFTFANSASVQATIRNEWVSILPTLSSTALLPSVRGSFDLAHAVSSHGPQSQLASAVVHGSWWKDAPDMNAYALETMYSGRTPTGAVAPIGAGLLVPDGGIAPEITTGMEAGADLSFRRFGLGLGLNFYHEQTSDVVLPMANGTTGALVARNAAAVTNQGIEARLSAQFGDGADGFGWNVAANAAKNSNSVDRLSGSASSVLLGPALWGMTVEARPGQPLGVFMGRRMLRNSNGVPILRNGLPVPDSASGPQQLGVGQPDWLVGLSNTIRYRWVSVTAVADAHIGGQVFSGTNLWGSYSGTLAATAFRPDSGLLIAGVDAAGKANTQHVSTQDYYHALGAIPEQWIYSASYFKVREARLSVAVPTGVSSLPFESVRASIVARNLYTWSKVPNVDPETVFSPYQLRGVEMGQLPSTRSIGVQLTIVP